ncbi:MAG: Muramidase-2 precursor, partial [Thermoleophilia bacterium]|nr:Muramidase-2 precursor [Thermoleophilia bacterium]
APAPAPTTPSPAPTTPATTPKPAPATTPKPAPAPAPAAPAAPKTKPYTVKAGDTLGALARTYKTTVDELAKLNSIADPNKIKAGTTIKVPA